MTEPLCLVEVPLDAAAILDASTVLTVDGACTTALDRSVAVCGVQADRVLLVHASERTDVLRACRQLGGLRDPLDTLVVYYHPEDDPSGNAGHDQGWELRELVHAQLVQMDCLTRPEWRCLPTGDRRCVAVDRYGGARLDLDLEDDTAAPPSPRLVRGSAGEVRTCVRWLNHYFCPAGERLLDLVAEGDTLLPVPPLVFPLPHLQVLHRQPPWDSDPVIEAYLTALTSGVPAPVLALAMQQRRSISAVLEHDRDDDSDHDDNTDSGTTAATTSESATGEASNAAGTSHA